MTLTDNCDLYVSLHENGVNQVVKHIMRQRPSLFNYATIDIVQNNELWCSKVEFTPDVQKYGNPIFTIQESIPILGADSPLVGLNFCIQLTGVRLDFHPGNNISLPSELNPPLPNQRFALQFQICGAIGCPSDKEVDATPVVPPRPKETTRAFPPVTPVDLYGKLNCFCLDVFAIGHFERIIIAGKECITGKVDDIEIVDIKPEGLEENIECYLKTTVNVIFRQKFSIPIKTLFIEFPIFDLANILLLPSPYPRVQHNPAIEEEQLKVFVDMKVTP